MHPCYWSIEQLPGISYQDQELLKIHDIKTTKNLLGRTRTSQAKNCLAIELKVPLKYINKWSALADLSQIPSVGYQHCGVVLHSGITSVLQLSQTSFQRLHPHIKRLYIANTQRKDLSPSVAEVKQWIEEAKQLIHFLNKEN